MKHDRKGIGSAVAAGIFIMIGCCLNLSLGGVLGVFMFSLGLLTIVRCKLDLFTGKIGAAVLGQISLIDLLQIFIGNLLGVILTYLMFTNGNLGNTAAALMMVKVNNGFRINLTKGVGCGFLVSSAVSKPTSEIGIIMSVMAFILLGMNHCIADFGYCLLASTSLSGWLILVPTILGNIIGGVIFTFLNFK